MNILSKYFTKQLIFIFVTLLLILTGLTWMVQIMSMMKFLLTYGVGISSFLGLTMLMIPFIASIIIPFVTFISVIFIYNKLISDNEIVVLASNGLSPKQIARPALILATFITVIHLLLNLFIVPASQARFYDTQWNLRYGLAHLKLQESAFTEMSHGLVVYVDRVAGHDLNQVMLSDTRDSDSQLVIFAEKGKLISTPRGLSIVMSNGSLHANKNGTLIGTFDDFDMDLNVSEKNTSGMFKVRRLPTGDLVKSLKSDITTKQYRTVLSELCTRFLTPFMNLILAALCTTILLRTSLLRRRASFSPALAVVAMAVIMATFMSASNLLSTITDFMVLTGCIFAVLIAILFILNKK